MKSLTFVQFAMEGKQYATVITASLMKNLEKIDAKALDDSLLRELVCWHSDQQMGSQPLGVVLISKETKCVACGSQGSTNIVIIKLYYDKCWSTPRNALP